MAIPYSRAAKRTGRAPPPEVIDDYDVFIAGGGKVLFIIVSYCTQRVI